MEVELEQERLQLQALANRRSNDALPIARLPDEVLDTILCFDHSNTPLREIPARNTALMKVSHRWMMAVIGYAHLWSSFNVGLPPRHQHSPRHRDLLITRTRIFVTRSKNAPLHLQIYPGVNDVVENDLRDCLVRCRGLDLHAFSSTTRDVPPLPYSNQLTFLQNLTIVAHKRADDGTCPPMLPGLEQAGCRLRRLTVSECEYDLQIWTSQFSHTILSSSLISLVVRASLDPDAFVDVLKQCPHLRYVSYTRDATAALQASASTSAPSEIYLSFMESLIITGENDVLRALARLSVPNLINLEIQRTYNSRTATELPLWLAPPGGPARFPNLRVMTLLYLTEWQPHELERFFITQPALEYFHTISLSETSIRGLLPLIDPRVCERLSTVLIQIIPSAHANPLTEGTLLDILERIWVPRKQARSGGAGIGTGVGSEVAPFTVRVDGHMLSKQLGQKLGALFDLPPHETVGQIKQFDIPLV